MKNATYRLSARAGLFAGLVAFAIYVVSSFSALQAPSLRALKLPTFHPIPAAIGAVLGFTLLQLVQLAKEKMTAGLVGLFVLFLVGTSSVAVFSYFFASPLRGFAIYFTLSTLFGMLVDVMLFPTAIETILNA